MGMGQGGPLRRLTTGVLVLLLVPTMATAQTSELREELADLGSERQRAERELEELTAREGDARSVLVAVSEELDDAEAELAELVDELARAEAELAAALAAADRARTRLRHLDAERQDTEIELTAKRDQLDARVRAAFKYGQVSFVEAFVGTRDVAEFLNSSTYVSSVLEGDRALVEDVAALLAEVEDQRREASSLRVETEREAAVAELATAEVERATREQHRLTDLIRERRAEREQALLALADDRSAVESHLVGLEAEGQRIGDQLATIARQQAEERAREEEAARRAEEQARAEREAAEAAEEQRRRDAGESARNGSDPPTEADPTSDGDGTAEAGGAEGWIRPVDGHVTSVYGPRWGRNHNGVDLAGTVGGTVVASRPGVVVHVISSCHPTSSFGCGGGFGNYVTVAHAGGMATIYAHLASVSVGTGQSVAAGESVGGVGNSGSSYGAHLHFEVREAGQPRDPCGYIHC